MSGAGNDFVVLDNRFYAFTPDELSGLAQRLTERRSSIGADGLLALATPEDEQHDFRMLYYNADGSRATMCGNGARCLARFARSAGFDRDTLHFETDAGVYRADVPAGEADPVTLHVPAPQRFRPHAMEGEEAWFVWTGTEHLVLFRDAVWPLSDKLQKDAPRYRHHPSLQPAGANVNFVRVLDAAARHVQAVTFEKGVEDWTLACGTGAVAIAVVSVFTRRVASFPVAVEMPGGTLVVGGQQTGPESVAALSLTGPAIVTFRGSVEW